MAGRADLTVDLESSSEGLVIVCLVELGVFPWVVSGVETAGGGLEFDECAMYRFETHPSSCGVMAKADLPNW